jgi:membrane associated rhomboid family serine protease
MFPVKDNITLTRPPLVTVALVAINVIAYLLEVRHGGSLFAGFSEGVSMLFLAIFGPSVEDRIGRLRFFVTLVEVPAVALLGFWFVVQLVLAASGLAAAGGMIGSGGEGVALLAQVGGFAFGLVAIRLFALRARPERPLAVY